MDRLIRMLLIAILGAGLVLAPAVPAVHVGQAMAAISAGGDGCVGDCCPAGTERACCSSAHAQDSHGTCSSDQPCDSCPQGSCDCTCCSGTMALVIALPPLPLELTGADVSVPILFDGQLLSARGDQPLLPPPIG